MAKDKICTPFLALASPENKFTVSTIEDMQSRKYLKVGDVVELNGYYTAGDGAGHKRKIEATDDGSGVQLANGLWANIVHDGEVEAIWFGLKFDGSDQFDVVSKLAGSGSTVFFSRENVVDPDSKGFYSKNPCTLSSGEIKFKHNTKFILGDSFEFFVNPIYDFTTHLFELGCENEIRGGNIRTGSNFKGVIFKQSDSNWAGVNKHYFANSYISDVTLYSSNYETSIFYGVSNVGGYYGVFVDKITGIGKFKDIIILDDFGPNSWLTGFRFTNIMVGGEGCVGGVRVQGTRCNEMYFGNIVKQSSKNEKGEVSEFIYNRGYANIFENMKAFDTSRVYPEGTLVIDSNDTDYSNTTPNTFNYIEISKVDWNKDKVKFHPRNIVEPDFSGNLKLNRDRNIKKYLPMLDSSMPAGTYMKLGEFVNVPSSTSGTLWRTLKFSVNARSMDSSINKTQEIQITLFKNNSEWSVTVDTNDISTVNLGNNLVFSNDNSSKAIIGYVNKVDDLGVLELWVKIETKLWGGLNIDAEEYSGFLGAIQFNSSIKNGEPRTPRDINQNYANSPVYTNIEPVGFKKAQSLINSKNFGKSNHIGGIDYITNRPNNVSDGSVLFDVSSKTWFTFYKGSWYSNTGQQYGSAIAIYSLNTPYHTLKMQQEGVYEDFIQYMDEKTEYDRLKRESEQQRQSVFEQSGMENYEEWLADQPMLLPVIEEPQPSEKLLVFKEKYLG